MKKQARKLEKARKFKHNYRCPSCGHTVGADYEIKAYCNPCKVNLTEIDLNAQEPPKFGSKEYKRQWRKDVFVCTEG